MTVFHIITGFLGSGKTTMLKNLLTNIPEGQRVAVIQNEFAPNGIDGTELKNISQNFHLIELNNGSVFCACLMGNFIASLKQIIHNYHPDVIYLEASGLSDPSTLWQVINEKELSGMMIPGKMVCVVDVLNYTKALKKLPGVLHQIRMADLVVLNKTDLVAGVQLAEAEKEIQRLNPLARTEIATYANIVFPTDAAYAEDKNLFLATIGAGSSRPGIQSASMKTGKRIRYEFLNHFLTDITALSIRSKGFLCLDNNSVVLYQSVFGTFTCNAYDNYSGSTEFTAIGENISPTVLRELFTKYSC